MAYLLDGAILVLFLVMVVIGSRRGFIKTIAGVAAFVVALVLASMLGGPVSDFVYEHSVEPAVIKAIDAQVGEGSAAAEKLDMALVDMPGFVTNILNNAQIESGADILEKLTATEEGESVAQSVSRQVVTPIVMPLLKMLCSLLLFLAASVLVSILLKALNVVAKLPLLKQLNKSLGALAGALLGVLWVFFAVSVLQVLASLGVTDVISAELLRSTTLVNWLCGINPVGGALQDILALIPSEG
ncbi:MAG: CvpA family protein [Clostridia bacterium]|nr:CvpA family protein [Clostridia bacterium]